MVPAFKNRIEMIVANATLPVNTDGIAPSLRDGAFIVWERRRGKKPPVCPLTGREIDATDPVNWLSFSDACFFVRDGAGDGIGKVIVPRVGVAGDLDDCVDRAGRISPE